MAENFSDFCCPSTINIVLFHLYFALSDLFSFTFCSIPLIYGLLVRFGSFSLLVYAVAGRQ